MKKNAIVLVTDITYLPRAIQTIRDVRIRGEWKGDIILLTIDFDAPLNVVDYYSLICKRVPQINVTELLKNYKTNPIAPTSDNREYDKLAQWNKFYLFSDCFKQWKKIIYLDAGLRVFDPVERLFSLDCGKGILIPEDGIMDNPQKKFGMIIDQCANPEVFKKMLEEFGNEIVDGPFFLNCIWMYDSVILDVVTIEEMIHFMNKYPICRCNEMTIMNLVIHYKYKLWSPFPDTIDGKKLFDWTDRVETWRDYSFIKYPRTIESLI
jgi:hypothetical protein